MLNLSKPVLRIDKREIAGDVVFIRHLPAPTILKFAERGQSEEDEKSVMFDLIIEALCDEKGESVNYSHDELLAQPFTLISELCNMIMEINSPSQKKS